MDPVSVVGGRIVPLERADVDTGQIMPKQFLKRTARPGFDEFLSHDCQVDDFIVNDPAYQAAKVLVTAANFGTGPSPEFTPWGLQQNGFRAVIAASFADIFTSNCTKIMLLPIELLAPTWKRLGQLAIEDPKTPIRIDLPERLVVTAEVHESFDIAPVTKHLLRAGLDDVELTLQHGDDLAAFQAQRSSHKVAVI